MKIELVNLKEVDHDLQLEVRNWRNADHVARYFQIPYIDDETHKNWLTTLNKEMPKNIAFLIKVNDEFIGLTYFSNIDYISNNTDWGIYIYKNDVRGIGVGKAVIKLSIDYARFFLNVRMINLEVLKSNQNAIELYKKNGFKFNGEKNSEVLCYTLIL